MILEQLDKNQDGIVCNPNQLKGLLCEELDLGMCSIYVIMIKHWCSLGVKMTTEVQRDP
jgi:hypothetical protein